MGSRSPSKSPGRFRTPPATVRTDPRGGREINHRAGLATVTNRVMAMRTNKLALACAAIVFASLLCTTAQAALSFVVNSPADTDAYDNPNTVIDEQEDGICADEFGNCTLNAAIEESRAGLPAFDCKPRTITFAVTTVTLTENDLPTLCKGSSIIGPVAINLNNQSLVTSSNSLVQNLTIIGGGIAVVGSNTTVKDSEISSGNTVGVLIGGNANTIVGNRITDNNPGVLISVGDDNVIGGTSAGERNVISGNKNAGIIISGNRNQVKGNFIGTDDTGTAAAGNGEGNDCDPVPLPFTGVAIDGSNNIIGGAEPGAGNVISGNNGSGVSISNAVQVDATGNLVQGNLIGLDATGTAPLGNLCEGIVIVNTPGNRVIENVIAFNGNNGVLVAGDPAINNQISQNRIFSNGKLGLDLQGDVGVSPNDDVDHDTGPNNLQNFPVLMGDGSLNSLPNTTFTIEFFSNAACDPLGHGEGTSFIGSTLVTTDGSGNASFGVPPGQFITATATDSNGNTSEFSACGPVITGIPLTCPATDSRRYAGRYRGTYSGDDRGTWSVRINKRGLIRGSGFSNDFQVGFSIRGCLTKGGRVNAMASGSAGNARWSGRIRVSSGKMAGSWVNDSAGASGTFRGKKSKFP